MMRATSSGLRVVACLLAITLGVPACTAGRGAPHGYVVDAVFPEAVALYEQSRVQVMGFDVGTVEAITLERDRVRVRMRIDPEVPLPADVHAGIEPFTLIGERTVHLYPAWRPGLARAQDGLVIPQARTRVPVEIDDALETFGDLSSAIDQQALGRLVTSTADAVAGRGEQYGEALDEVSDLVGTVDALDGQILSLAQDVSSLASTLNAREEQVVQLIDGVRKVADVLADHRDDAERMLSALVRLDEQGGRLLRDHAERLPRLLARLADLGLLLRSHADTVQELIASYVTLAAAVSAAFDEDADALALRISVTGLTEALLLGVLETVADSEAQS